MSTFVDPLLLGRLFNQPAVLDRLRGALAAAAGVVASEPAPASATSEELDAWVRRRKLAGHVARGGEHWALTFSPRLMSVPGLVPAANDLSREIGDGEGQIDVERSAEIGAALIAAVLSVWDEFAEQVG